MKKKVKLPKISFNKVRKSILYLLIFLGIFSGGYIIGSKGYKLDFASRKNIQIVREVPPGKEDVDFSLFWEVWDILEKNYLEKTKINYSEMIYGAIGGMVSSLGDPYTAFLPPKENKIIEEDLSGAFEGIGIQLGYKGKQLAVITPLPDSPAEKAGVKAGDLIIGLKDEAKEIDTSTGGMTLTDAVKIIRGPAGSKITLLLLRDGSEDSLLTDIVRAKIDVPTLILSFIGEAEEIAHIRLLKFGAETLTEWQKIVREILKKESARAVILDLRGNPGGYMDGAIDIAAEFIDNNSVVVVEERSSGTKKEYKTNRIGLLTKTPFVILVNEGSASASEILAGALREIKKVTIIGDTSFGKGTIQEPIQLENGAGIHITVAKWLTPSGFWVNEQGIEPDILIEDNIETTEDEQLLKAIEIVKEKI
ncbi:MAG: S41 family peptidase [Patescibacteria group bacterium]